MLVAEEIYYKNITLSWRRSYSTNIHQKFERSSFSNKKTSFSVLTYIFSQALFPSFFVTQVLKVSVLKPTSVKVVLLFNGKMGLNKMFLLYIRSHTERLLYFTHPLLRIRALLILVLLSPCFLVHFPPIVGLRRRTG